jgi:hypothetical protein
MSLHVLADHMASKGRNGDSMLVHMTPGEVAGLHALALKHGGSLTTNPDTGLPEANFLKSLLPMIAGFALGPAGFGLVSSGLTAGAIVGGVTGLATGSLSKGLMAGLGAYGGFGIGESLATAGAGALTDSAASSAYGASAGMTDAAARELGFATAEEAAQNAAAQAAKSFDPSQVAGFDKATAGFNAATSSGGAAFDFAKNNKLALGMAAAPIMADMMVPTTTKMPTNTNPAYIRQYVTGDRPQAPRALAPVLASDWGSRSFSDAYAKPMAKGGIVALAEGGYKPTDAEIFNYFKTPDLTDAKIAQDMQTFGVSAADIARATGTQNQQADYEKRFVNTLVAPGTDASEFLAATKAVGLQDQGLAAAMQNAGLSQGAQYALTHAQSDKDFTGGIIDASTGKPVDFYTNLGYTAGALPGDQGGLEGLYANINYATSGLQNLINSGQMSVADAQNAALAELARTNLSIKDVKAATGKDFGSLFTPKEEKKTTTVVNPYTGIASAAGPTTTTVLPTNPTTNAPAGTSNPYGNVNNPGDLTFNPDGTVTVQPNLPGRPYGGYSGITELTNAYTAGGGRTGYVSPVVRTPAEHDAMYNKQTDDSLDAYNYLIGKAGAKYPKKSRATEIMKPYEEAVLGYPSDITKKKYINVDGKMVLNPQYVAPKTLEQRNSETSAAAATAAKAGKAPTIEVTDSSGETSQTYTAVLQDDGNYLAGNGKRYTAAGAEIMAQGGMAGYAVGGGLGSLGSYSDGGRLLKGPGDGVSDSIPATIGRKQQPARLADGEFVVPARIVSELGNGSTDAGARKLYAMMDRVQKARGKTTGKKRVATNTRADKYLPA